MCSLKPPVKLCSTFEIFCWFKARLVDVKLTAAAVHVVMTFIFASVTARSPDGSSSCQLVCMVTRYLAVNLAEWIAEHKAQRSMRT
jgi:hypothetical protein